MNWVIVRTDQGGGVVAKSGGEHSYTKDPSRMLLYFTEAGARADCCENEVPRRLTDTLK